jgi:hypothetical protein
MSFVLAAVAVVGAGVKIYQGVKAKKEAKELQAQARQQLDQRLAQYEALDTSNPYKNLENTFEDLTVNQQQAEFQKRQQEQQQANIMQGLQGAAGGSGIAALAQTLANQQSLDAERASASIGQQESRNQQMAAQQAAQNQAMERQGEVISRQMNKDKIGTMLGMEQQNLRDANFLRADANKQIGEGAGQMSQVASGMMQKEKSIIGGVAKPKSKKKKK